MKVKSFVFLSHTVASRAKIYVFLPIASIKSGNHFRGILPLRPLILKIIFYAPIGCFHKERRDN